MPESNSGNGSNMRTLLALLMFSLGVNVSGAAMLIRSDFLGREAAAEVESRRKEATEELKLQLNQRIDDTLTQINGRLQKIEDKLP